MGQEFVELLQKQYQEEMARNSVKESHITCVVLFPRLRCEGLCINIGSLSRNCLLLNMNMSSLLMDVLIQVDQPSN